MPEFTKQQIRHFSSHIRDAYREGMLTENQMSLLKSAGFQFNTSIECPVVCMETATMYESIKNAAKAVGLKFGVSISGCLSGKQKSAAGYHWRYATDKEIAAGRCLSEPVAGLPKTKKAKRPVVCIETATMYKSITAAAKDVGRSSSSIFACLKGKAKSAGGYHWRYATDKEVETGKCLSISKADLPDAYRSKRPAVCIETATMYPTIIDAAKAVGLTASTSISACLRGKAKSAGGYHWRDATDEEIAAGKCLSEPVTDLPESHRPKTSVVCMETATMYPTIKDAAKAVGLKDNSSIYACLRGTRRTAGGYHWRVATGEEVATGRCLSEPITGLPEAHRLKRPVVCMETAVMYESMRGAAKTVGLKNCGSIIACLKGEQKSAGGYHWRFATNEEIAEGKCLSEPITDLPKTEKKKTPVVCMETATMYESITTAAKAVGLKSCSFICACLKGRQKSAGGYHWRYATDEEATVSRCLAGPVTDLPEAHRPKSPVVCMETATMYESQVDAARAVGLKTGAPISACLSGKTKTAGGYHWRYATDEEIAAGHAIPDENQR